MPRLIMFLALFWPALAWAQPAPDVSAESPGRVLAFAIGASPEGRITYRIDRLGKPIIAPSEMGFLFTDQPELLRNFKLLSSSTSDRDETWTQPWGEYRSHPQPLPRARRDVRGDQWGPPKADRRSPAVR